MWTCSAATRAFDTQGEECISLNSSELDQERKKTLILREYLIQELNYSEKLEMELVEKTEELANAIRREEISNKRHECRINELLIFNTKNGRGVDSLSESLLGRYICKSFDEYGTFFGLIASFDHPYYKVRLHTKRNDLHLDYL